MLFLRNVDFFAENPRPLFDPNTLFLMRRFFALLVGLQLYNVLPAQDYDYTMYADSVTWNELSTQTILNTNNAAWNLGYDIPIGFTFNMAGRNFTSLRIETIGYLRFDEDDNYAFTMFNEFRDHVDSNGVHAVLGYQLSGTAGNHILKIQYKNTSTYPSGPQTLTYQVWLREDSNIVEVRVGPNKYHTYPENVWVTDTVTWVDSLVTIQVIDTFNSARIGCMTKNMNLPLNGYFVGGTWQAPIGVPCDQNNPEPAFFRVIPFQGRRYVFTPSPN
jgi:hypothetical protein